MWNNKPVSDVNALLQAIQPFMQSYPIRRSVIRSYNERGRVDDVKVKNTVNAVITRGTTNIGTNQQGFGRRNTVSYNIVAVIPEYFEIGDIIFHPQWGALQVTSVDDTRYLGAISGTLTMVGTTESSDSKDNKLYEPD